jgi:hypothetical protein
LTYGTPVLITKFFEQAANARADKATAAAELAQKASATAAAAAAAAAPDALSSPPPVVAVAPPAAEEEGGASAEALAAAEAAAATGQAEAAQLREQVLPQHSGSDWASPVVVARAGPHDTGLARARQLEAAAAQLADARAGWGTERASLEEQMAKASSRHEALEKSLAVYKDEAEQRECAPLPRAHANGGAGALRARADRTDRAQRPAEELNRNVGESHSLLRFQS